MNNKEKYLHKILDAVVESCSYIGGGRLSIAKEDILGKSRNENVVMTRCIESSNFENSQGYFLI